MVGIGSLGGPKDTKAKVLMFSIFINSWVFVFPDVLGGPNRPSFSLQLVIRVVLGGTLWDTFTFGWPATLFVEENGPPKVCN